MLLNGTANPTEFQLKRQKSKYDLRSDDGRLSYIREAIDILTERGVSPTARDVYAGRLADETGVSKQAIVSQMQARCAPPSAAITAKNSAICPKRALPLISVCPTPAAASSALGAASAARQLAAALLQSRRKNPSCAAAWIWRWCLTLK